MVVQAGCGTVKMSFRVGPRAVIHIKVVKAGFCIHCIVWKRHSTGRRRNR